MSLRSPVVATCLMIMMSQATSPAAKTTLHQLVLAAPAASAVLNSTVMNRHQHTSALAAAGPQGMVCMVTRTCSQHLQAGLFRYCVPCRRV
jgi:hypothetical protein